jgi:hypothetical protein
MKTTTKKRHRLQAGAAGELTPKARVGQVMLELDALSTELDLAAADLSHVSEARTTLEAVRSLLGVARRELAELRDTHGGGHE